LLSVYGRQPEQPAALPTEFLTDWLTAAQTGDTSSLQRWAGTEVPVQALSGLGTLVSRVAATPSQIELTEARAEETRAGAELTRVETRRKEIETQLLERSEERRVGKESRSKGTSCHYKIRKYKKNTCTTLSNRTSYNIG